MLKALQESYRVKKNRPLSFVINWLGLTLAFTAVIVVYLYVTNEMNHDRQLRHGTESTYRVELDWDGITPAPLAEFLTGNIPEILAASRITREPGVTISTAESGTGINNIKVETMYADSSLLTIFPYKILAGGGAESLSSIDKVLISESTALSLFGTKDAIGHGISFKNKLDVMVTGVFEDVEQPAVFRPDIILNIKIYIPMFGVPDTFMDSWSRYMYETHIALVPGADPRAVTQKIKTALKDRALAVGDQIDQTELDQYTIRPFDDIYFSNDLSTHGTTADPDNLEIMAAIALLILIIGIINYVNIYTARTTEIVRTMGVKQIMGSTRGALIFYVIFDSILIAFVSALTAYFVALLLEPVLISLLGYPMPFTVSLPHAMVLFVAFPVLCGLMSGLFPAVYLTRLNPLQAIANRNSGGRAMGAIRNSLIVFQFTISIGLIAAMLIINRQISHFRTMDTGINRENIVIVDGGQFMKARFATFRSQLLTNSNVINAGISKWLPSNVGERAGIKANEADADGDEFGTDIMWVDDNMFSILGIRLLSGDTLHMSATERTGKPRWLINEHLADQIKASKPQLDLPSGLIAGIVSDFNYQSLHSPIGALTIAPIYQDGYENCDAYIKISGHNLDETLKFIEHTFRETFPKEIYGFSFFDTRFEEQYQLEAQMRKWLIAFSLVAIMIACLGLFSLVGYSVERRRKEIGLRKINGATEREVMLMLCGSFLRWLGVSFVIAVPVVYIVMNSWMQGFAYKADIVWWIFAVAGVVTLIIALATVFYQSWKAAIENPARSLKSE